MKFLLLFTLSFLHLYAFSYIITARELDKNIHEKFPIEKSFVFSKFIFSNPSLSIKKKSNLIYFECDAYNSSLVTDDGKSPIFRIYARSDIRYENGNIFLTKIHIDKITNDNLSPKLEEKLIKGTEFLLKLYFSKKPIYTINNTTYAVKIAKSMIDDIIVADGVVKITFLE